MRNSRSLKPVKPPHLVKTRKGRQTMSGTKVIQYLMKKVCVLTDEQAAELWADVRARLKAKRCTPTIKEVEACASGNLDTAPRDITQDALAFALTGYEFWPSPYPGSTFIYDLLTTCISRGYMESDGTLENFDYKRFEFTCSDGVNMIKQKVVRAEYYDALEAEVAELRQLLAAKSVDPETQLAADRWNAVMDSARLRIVGSAGFKPSTYPGATMFENGHRHFGCEFWSHHDAVDGEKENAKEMITAYADLLIAQKA
jgi:hypothetical protein